MTDYPHSTGCRLSVEQQQRLAESLLGCCLEEGGFCPCPGAEAHTTGSGRRDFRLFFEPGKMPREHCFHSSCQGARDDFMGRLFAAIRAEERGSGGGTTRAPFTPKHADIVPPPVQRVQAPAFSRELAEQVASTAREDWDAEKLSAHSPIAIPADPAAWPRLLLDSLFPPAQRILLFTRFTSQGDFLYSVGRGLCRLGRQPGQKAQPCSWADFPAENGPGAWWLSSPVSGKWQSNPNNGGKPGRRHGGCCTGHPYAVLESDTLEPALWLRILVQLREPIAAVYTSGGKSLHALIRVDARTHSEFNAVRARLLRLAAVGADPAAITAVRLTRLPGIRRTEKRGDNLQRLLYLNPSPSLKPIQDRPFIS